VVDDNEELDSEHVRSAAGAAWAINYHAAHDFQGGLEAVRTMPGGNAWADVIQKTPEGDRHFSIHDGHLMYLNEADQAAWGQGGSSIITDVTFTGDPGRLRALVDDYAGQGVTELAVMTSGPDIPRELERYINALA
jgi:5,10-methylenetetrahydromethanopterin reductase